MVAHALEVTRHENQVNPGIDRPLIAYSIFHFDVVQGLSQPTGLVRRDLEHEFSRQEGSRLCRDATRAGSLSGTNGSADAA